MGNASAVREKYFPVYVINSKVFQGSEMSPYLDFGGVVTACECLSGNCTSSFSTANEHMSKPNASHSCGEKKPSRRPTMSRLIADNEV